MASEAYHDWSGEAAGARLRVNFMLKLLLSQNFCNQLLMRFISFASNIGPAAGAPAGPAPTPLYTNVILHSQPAGQQLTVDNLRVLTKELHNVRAKWYNIGVQLGVSVGTLKAIEKQYLNDPTDCLRETLTTLLISSTPTWTNIVDALNVVGEVRLAVDLQYKYCSTQDMGAIHQHAPSVPAIPPSQPHAWTTLHPQSTVPFTQPPAFASPYSVLPQPHPSHLPPWSAPHYYLLPSSYPVSTPSLPPPPSGAASIATSLSVYSQLPQLPPDPTPSVPSTPVHPANLPSDAVPSMTIQPHVAAGM